MIRFVLRVAGLWIFLLALLLIARLIGSLQPIPENVAILHLTDCEFPCWIGIIPGKTTLGEARQRVRQIYGNLPGYIISETSAGDFSVTSDIRYEDEGPMSRGLSEIILESGDSTDQSIVEIIVLWEIIPSRNNPDIGSLQGILGSPTYIFLRGSGTAEFPDLAYPNLQLIVGLNMTDCASVPMGKIVGSLTLYAHMPPPESWPFIPRPWRGFNRCYDLYQRWQP